MRSKTHIYEDDIVKVTDYELYYFRQHVDWDYFAENFTNKNPDQLWKILPFINWKELSERGRLSEDFIILFSDFILFKNIRPHNITKNIVMKFHNRIDWSKIIDRPIMDKDIVKRFHDKYALDWNYLINKVAFSEYEIEKYVAIHGLSWETIFNNSKNRLSPTMIRRHHKVIFGSREGTAKFGPLRPVPSDILDIYADRLDWETIVRTQTTLEPWFIMKHYDKLITRTKEHLVTARNYIKEKSHLPAIYLLKNYQWQQDFYPKDSNSNLPKTIEPIFPDPKQLENSRIVYYTSEPLMSYEKEGLRFASSDAPQYYEVIQPWRFHEFIILPRQRMMVKNKAEIIPNYLRRSPYLAALYIFKCGIWRKELYFDDDPINYPQSINPILPDAEHLKKYQLVYYTNAHLNNLLIYGLEFFPNEKRPFYKAVKPWKLYDYLHNEYIRSSTTPRPTLRFVLKRNGFGTAKDRSASFNKFLKEHKCL